MERVYSIQAANGLVEVSQEAEVYIKEVNTYVHVKLVEGSPAVFSLGRLCAEMVYSYTWTSGRKPRLTRSKVTIECSSETYVPLVIVTEVAGPLQLTKVSTRGETLCLVGYSL